MGRLRLRVSPGAARAEIAGRYGDAWKVRVQAPSENGRANAAVIRLLAETLAVPRETITVVSGRSSRDKIVEFEGLSPAVAERRLASATLQKGRART